MIRLLVKGNRDDARVACDLRKILIFDTYENCDNETQVEVLDEEAPAVVRWFAEPPRDAPYPVGTLLFFEYGTPDRAD